MSVAIAGLAFSWHVCTLLTPSIADGGASMVMLMRGDDRIWAGGRVATILFIWYFSPYTLLLVLASYLGAVLSGYARYLRGQTLPKPCGQKALEYVLAALFMVAIIAFFIGIPFRRYIYDTFTIPM
ncbi:hypothetical protein JYT11_01030 [Planctomycetaceae bacterium AH-315-I19]|nr:hypothetical protein [Planctomycetaceae bacterium AH-315-I19]